MADLTGMMQAAAGNAGEAIYIEDVFSTYLYTGNTTTTGTQTITNGIDLDGEGGLVWVKNRSDSNWHALADTETGITKQLYSNDTSAQTSNSGYITSANVDGFSVGASGDVNFLNDRYASWTFRKAKKFFDVVTYTGNGANRTISHNLGSVPGCIIVKRTDTTGAWQVYHRANTAAPETDYLVLNTDAATADSDTRWNDTLPTSTVFSVGTEATVNANGGTYVAYLFAHDAGGFGDDGLQNVITCGSFTPDGSGNATVNLGYEPQWLLIKNTQTADFSWIIWDTMRGFSNSSTAGSSKLLYPNLIISEDNGQNTFPTATGFSLASQAALSTYIYIAIRRGPMKTPTAGTEVYNAIARTGTGAAATVTGAGFAPDFSTIRRRTETANWWVFDRLRGATNQLYFDGTDAEGSEAQSLKSFDMDGVSLGTSVGVNKNSISNINYFFKRAPGFFDVVCYTGTGANTTFNHNLGVVPELMIVKRRSATGDWQVYAGSGTEYLVLNSTAAKVTGNSNRWNSTAPTSSVFSLGTDATVNASGGTYVNYLFASLAGVSKIGTYTGNGSSVTVTTGFQPRFILVKRTDSTGNWIVGDSARGLVAGDDPFLLLNSTAAETTNQDWVDITSTSFTVNETAANACVNNATYIYLCIS
jgi:hypothetical protein